MSKRDFTKVSPHVWQSQRFRRLVSDAQLLYLYLLTCNHQNSAGCFCLPDLYACSDLGWEADRFRSARSALIVGDMISFDENSMEVYVHRWFKHSPPMNEKHSEGTQRLISEVESDEIRARVEEEFQEADTLRIAKANEKAEREAARMRGPLPRPSSRGAYS